MNKILMIFSLLFIGCSNNVSQVDAIDKAEQEKHETTTSEARSPLQLDNGARWKADEATKNNIAAMVKVINDSSNIGTGKKEQLAKLLQIRIDTLVRQCKMKGPAHDALHVWLEQVLHDLKELKEEYIEYQQSYVALKKDVESFFTHFE